MVGTLVGTTGGGASAAPAAGARVPVGQPPRLPAATARIGALGAGTQLQVDVALQPRDPAALTRYAAAVSALGSPAYHRYMTVRQFGATFGATDAAIASVEADLAGNGLHPGPVSANRLVIPVSGSVAAVQKAFSTSLVQYRLPAGRVAYANATAPTLPATVAPYVQSVLGLDNVHLPHPLTVRPSGHLPEAGTLRHPLAAGVQPLTSGPHPCTDAQSAASTFGSYTADQFATAYGYSGLYSAGDLGAGQTIALYELEPNSASDISTYATCYGLHNAPPASNYLKVDGGSGSGTGQGEAALDIETVMSAAPNANVLVYQGPNNSSGPYDTYAAIVSQDRATVISVSWGECEAFAGSSLMSAENVLFEEAAVQGQTFVVAAGDSGSEACYQADTSQTQLSVGDPASQPFVTSVGGTRLEAIGPPPSEIVWNDAYDGNGAGGGGVSSMWATPGYQTQYGITGPAREVPDVSANADPETGYTIYFSGNGGGWQSIGGTSAATPLWASLFTLANAQCPSPVGFANPALYYAYSSADPTVVGNDIVAVSNVINNNDNDYTGTNSGQYPVLTGYDMATGLGSPIASALSGVLCHQVPTWLSMPGAATDLSVGANASAWAIGTGPVSGGYGIYYWNRSTLGWSHVSGAAVTIAVGPHGDPWVLSSTHHIYHWNGGGWTLYPGAATDIAVGANGQVWVIGTGPVGGGYPIYRWNGSGWTHEPGAAVTVAVGPQGDAWVLSSTHQVYHWNGGGWTLYPGAATDIAVGANGEPWVLGVGAVSGGYPIYRWSGGGWSQTGGAAVTITVGPHGDPWILDSAHHIYAS